MRTPAITLVPTIFAVLLPALVLLTGCSAHEPSLRELLPSITPTLSNAEAVDRALQLCALTHGDRPFHLVMNISPPVGTSGKPAGNVQEEMRAQVELFWLSPIAYRTEIRSRDFSQIRIVNRGVVEEHNTGDFYPRWIQNFVDALLDPVPRAATLRKLPGTIPVSPQSHACIANPDRVSGVVDETSTAQICFQDTEPRIASGIDYARYVSFDDFAPFGSQQIARTLVNDLPANFLLPGHIEVLEPLRQSDYPLLKAAESTPPAEQIRTMLVSRATAQSLIESTLALPETKDARPTAKNGKAQAQSTGATPAAKPAKTQTGPQPRRIDLPVPTQQQATPEGGGSSREAQRAVLRAVIYVRTDRTGRVREAYRDNLDTYGLEDDAVARALRYKFSPLIVNGVPQQMEAPLVMP